MNRRRSVSSLVLFALLSAFLLSAGDTYVNMGSGAFLLGQPVVQIQVYTPDDPATPENEEVVYHPDGSGDYIYDSFVLDTGANGLMIAKGRNEVSLLVPMEANGFVSDEAQYEEMGVGGSTMYGVSAAYSMDYAGSDGVPLTLPGVRFMCNAETELGYEGIIGMPAMAGRVVHLDFSVWSAAELGTFMETLFANAPPPAEDHRYTIPLRMTHFEQEGQQNPGDPLPTWAPLPFLDAWVRRGASEAGGNFLLDTGAQLSMINNAIAVSLGLDTNGNGMIDVEEAQGTVQISGVGGVRDVPIVSVGGIRIPSLEGTDLVWKEFEVIVLDIVPGIDGIIGMDLLHSGWMGRALGDAAAEPGAIDHIYFDFRDIADDQAEMILDLHPTRDVVLNQDAPLVAVEPENGPLSKVAQISFLVTFDQDVTGFVADDLELTNASLLGFAEVTPGLVYRVTVQAEPPEDGGGDDWDWGFREGGSRDLFDLFGGAVTVRVAVPALVAENAAGSGNDRGAGEAVHDANAMTATLATTVPSPASGTPVPFSLEFDGTVLDFAENRIEVRNGSVTNFQAVAAEVDPDDPFAGLFVNSAFTFDVVPGGNGPVTVTVPTVVSDGFTTLSSYLGDETTITFAGFPEVALSSAIVSPTSATSVIVLATFSRAVVGFGQEDVGTANAEVIGFVEVVPGLEYELTIAPLAPGPVAVALAKGAALDAANGLGSLAAAFAFEAVSAFLLERIDLATFRLRVERAVADPFDPGTYVFDPALEILSVEEESPGVYLIRTGTQSLGGMYSLTIGGVAQEGGGTGDETVEFVSDALAISFLDGDGGTVTLGQAPGADDGLGDGFDQESGGGAGNQPVVRILNTTGEGGPEFLACDVRRADGGMDRWYIEVVFPGGRRDPWVFSWQVGAMEEGWIVLLQELRDDAPYGPPVDMMTVGGVELAEDAVFQVLAGPAEETGLQFQVGWNLVGTPLVTLASARESASDGTRGCMMGGDTVTRFVDGAYQACDAELPLLAESGYWIYAEAAGSGVPVQGLRDDGVVLLRAGWNLVTPTVACTSAELGLSAATVWTWMPLALRYRQLRQDDPLVPGTGYWIHVAESRVLLFPEPEHARR